MKRTEYKALVERMMRENPRITLDEAEHLARTPFQRVVTGVFEYLLMIVVFAALAWGYALLFIATSAP